LGRTKRNVPGKGWEPSSFYFAVPRMGDGVTIWHKAMAGQVEKAGKLFAGKVYPLMRVSDLEQKIWLLQESESCSSLLYREDVFSAYLTIRYAV
jgi:hypothetical protein